jgi:hypothetical protein
MQRNLARLGAWAHPRERTWDERLGDIGPPVPLLPIVCTVGIIAVVVGAVVLIASSGWALPRLF